MGNTKSVREKGKLKLSRYFTEFNEKENVAVVREISVQPRFPLRLQGRTGTIEGKKGRAYIVKINDQTKYKRYLIEPVHLKRIELKRTK